MEEPLYRVEIKEGGKWKPYPDQPASLNEFEANAHMAHVRCHVDGSTELRVAKAD